MNRRQRFSIGLIWFFCLGGLGSFFPFYSLYLSENAGLTGSQIGMVLAMLPLVGMAAQPLWGQLADRTGSRTGVLVLLGAGAAVGYAALATVRTYPAFLLGTAALACFATAIVPNAVSVTLALARKGKPYDFGMSRVWGTVGFFVLVVSFPSVLDAWQAAQRLAAVPGGPSEPGLDIMFPVTALFVLTGALVALTLPRTGAVALRASRGEWRLLLQHGPFVRALGFSFTGYFFLQGPMTMFSVYVRSQGGTLDSVSDMWILMLLLEIPLVGGSGLIRDRIGPRGLLAMGVIAGGLRWAACGFSADLAWIHASSILHGVTVAGLVVGGPLYVESVVPERLRSTGQGMLAMIGFSLGGILSNVACGWLFEYAGPRVPYMLGGVGGLALGVLVPLILPSPERPETSTPP